MIIRKSVYFIENACTFFVCFLRTISGLCKYLKMSSYSIEDPSQPG